MTRHPCIRPFRRWFFLYSVMILAALISAVPAAAVNLFPESDSGKVIALNLTAYGVITAWGISQWDYGDKTPHAESEHWFSDATKEGGADKMGHLFTTYLFSHGTAGLCSQWGYDRESAARIGALSAFGIMGFMEAGDAFSDYGFAYEDFLMNTAGALAGYYVYAHPRAAGLIDLRIGYDFSFSQADFTTDYEHLKYELVFKLSGCQGIENSVLKMIEFHAGYYARGYKHTDPDRSRNLFFAVGFNISRFFEQMNYPRISKALNYFQMPGFTAGTRRDFNRDSWKGEP